MEVTLLTRATCPIDGCCVRGLLFRGFRISKRSMRSTSSPGLAWLPRECPECRHPMAAEDFAPAGLDPKSLVEVEAYRLRRWPELSAALPDTTPGETPA
jgi:hypothetical protein